MLKMLIDDDDGGGGGGMMVNMIKLVFNRRR